MEIDFHHWLNKHLPRDTRQRVPVGDDAAVLEWPQATCVVTSDLLADGVHFVLGEIEPERIGRKCLAVNLSDIAAMAAEPVAAIVSLLIPRSAPADLAKRLYDGMLPLANEHNTLIAGGDTNTWDGRLAISIALFATSSPQGDLRRDTARVGDVLLVSGTLGGSLAGHHLDFEPRIALARYLHENFELTGGMDLSDGLATDATRLASQSGCGIELELSAIPISDSAVRMAAEDPSRSALERALGDGEDFELLLAAGPDEAQRMVRENASGVRLTVIGKCVSNPGVWYVDQDGNQQLCPVLGYEHRLDA